MNPFEQMQSLADLWSKSGKAFATAQQGLFSGMADTMAKAAGAGDQRRSRPSRPTRRASKPRVRTSQSCGRQPPNCRRL